MAIETFFNNETQSAFKRYKNFEELIPNLTQLKHGGTKKGSNHTGEEGRFVESIVRELLNKYLPKNLRALTGFILRPMAVVGGKNNQRLLEQEGNLHSTQIDILVYDVNNYPIYEKFEDFVVVPPEGVIAIIQIKKTFYEAQLADEIDKLIFNASLCRHYIEYKHAVEHSKPPKKNVIGPVTAILSFTAEWENKDSENIKAIEKTFKTIDAFYSGKNYDTVINIFSIIDRLSLVKGRKGKRSAPVIPYLHYSDDAVDKVKAMPAAAATFLPATPATAARVETCINNDDIQYHVGIQYLLWHILKNYYHRTRQPNIVMPGFTYLSKERIIKLNRHYIPVNLYSSRITKQENMIIPAMKKLKKELRRKYPSIANKYR